jgi:hypothetical protein
MSLQARGSAVPRLSKDEWAMLAKEYAANISVAQLAKRYGVARQTIMERAKKQGWTVRPREEIYDATQAKLQGVSYDATPEAKAALTHAIADDRARLIQEHQRGWRKVHALRADAYLILEGKPPKIIREMRQTEGSATLIADLQFKDLKERAKFAQMVIAMYEADARALSTAQEGERRSNGMDYKAQAESKQIDEVEARERKALIASLVNLSQTYHERTKAKQEETA